MPLEIFEQRTTFEEIDRCTELKRAHLMGTSARNMLSAFGDFWQSYYVDYEDLKTVSSASTVLVSREYNKMLHKVLYSNVLEIPTHDPIEYKLLMFDSAEAEVTEDYVKYQLEDDVQSLEFLTNALFEPSVVLEEQIHYTVSDGAIYFKVDIFNDSVISELTSQSTTSSGRKIMVLWALNMIVDELYIYERFGTFLYSKSVNSQIYKNLIIALQYFYTNTKSVKNIESILSIMLGAPFCRYAKETILEIAEIISGDYIGYTRIKTTKGYYMCSPYAELVVVEGDEVTLGDVFARFHRVEDWKSNPDWYADSVRGVRFPWDLVTRYLPVGAYDHSGLADHDGAIEYGDDTLHFDDVRDMYLARNGGSPDEQRLYNLIHEVLKYNLIYVYTTITAETYEAFKQLGNVQGITDLISSGLPSYLHVVVDQTLAWEFEDKVDEIVDASFNYSTIGSVLMEDDTFYEEKLFFDGTIIADGSVSREVEGIKRINDDDFTINAFDADGNNIALPYKTVVVV